jgi:hypothetical protein
MAEIIEDEGWKGTFGSALGLNLKRLPHQSRHVSALQGWILSAK